MPSINLSFKHKNDPYEEELLEFIDKHGVLISDSVSDWNVILIGEGMQSGKPAILVWIPTDQGIVFLQTSLDNWSAATIALAAIAETKFGYPIHD
jgi:hypothetical protein